MRILLWHAWLLSGTGSNVATARVAEALRADGHDVLLLSQERHPERFPFLDAFGVMSDIGPQAVSPTGVAPAGGRVTLLRPAIGPMLPVFVWDEYEGFDEVTPFVDLTDAALQGYLDRNAEALRAAAAWHRSEAVLAGHVVPGAPVAGRALRGSSAGIPYGVKVHGSDLEYAVRLQPRYRALAAEGLADARAVFGPTEESLERTVALVPESTRRLVVCSPGVDVRAFRPGPRGELLEHAASLLDDDGSPAGGRTPDLDEAVEAALDAGTPPALDELAARYDPERPDADAARKLRALTGGDGPIVGYLGKLIPQKGVHLLLAAMAAVPGVRVLIVGFGTFRERLEALTLALARADAAAVRELWPSGDAPPPPPIPGGGDLRRRVTFTGRLDHRYASLVVGAADVLVVPSIGSESFGMVAAEGAAAGALPLAARHSGLREVARALEDAAGLPGLFSFEQGAGAVGEIEAGVRRLLALPVEQRRAAAVAIRGHVAREWTWGRAAARYVEELQP